MARLINCKDCGNTISKNAESCPHCGAKNKQTSIITWLALIFIGIPVLWSVFSASFINNDVTNTSAVVDEVSPSETLEVFEFYEPNFDKKAGSAIYVAQMMIRKNMKDPDSAEFRATSYVKAAPELPATVCGEVTGKNSFNGYSGYKSYFFITDNALYSIDDGTTEFEKAYNGFCILK